MLIILMPFLYNAVIWAFFQSVGSLPLFMLLLKIIVSGSLIVVVLTL